MFNPDTRSPEIAKKNNISQVILTTIIQNITERFDVDPSNRCELARLSEQINKSQLELIDEQGDYKAEACQQAYLDTLSNARATERMGTWLALSAVDIGIATNLQEDPAAEPDYRYRPCFSEAQVRGGNIIQGEHTKKILTPQQLNGRVDENPKIDGEIGPNATIDFRIISKLKESDLNLLKSALEAEELDPLDPDYQAYFRNVSLGKGRIQGDEIMDKTAMTIKNSNHFGTVYRTNIPNYVLVVTQDRTEKTDDSFSIKGYYIFPDLLKRAEEIFQLENN
ncbi:MAG: hypothetical protein WCV92_02710 [Candidatus Buchananbacteria bacterium]